MKRKVLIISTWYPSSDSPLNGVFVHEQAQALAREYDVAVLIPELAAWRHFLRSDATGESAYFDDVPVFREYSRPLVPHGAELVTYHTLARAGEKGYRKLLKQWGKPDLLHAHVVLPAGWVALKLGRKHSIPVVLTEHSGPFSMHLDTKCKRTLASEMLAGADRIVAVSPALKQQMSDFQPDIPIAIIGNLVRTDFFVPGGNGQPKEALFKFLVVARLSAEKGLGYLLDAIHLLVNQGVTKFRVTIAGDGPDRQSLEERTRELGLQEWCQFVGHVERFQVRDLIQQCDAFILPSLHETFGIVLGEAMSCGKPVIATRCGGPEFVVTRDSGILVDAADSAGLANAMSDFIMKRVTFSASDVRDAVVSRFSSAAFLEQIGAVYNEVWQE